MSFLSKTFKYVNSLRQSIVFDYEHGYLISKPDGIDTISVTANTAKGIGQVGATVQSKAIQTRPITINGRVIGKDAQSLKDALMTVVRPDLTGVLYAGDWHIDVIVTASPTIGASKRGAPFQLGLPPTRIGKVANERQCSCAACKKVLNSHGISAKRIISAKSLC